MSLVEIREKTQQSIDNQWLVVNKRQSINMIDKNTIKYFNRKYFRFLRKSKIFSKFRSNGFKK